jgi:hypothetical protein
MNVTGERLTAMTGIAAILMYAMPDLEALADSDDDSGSDSSNSNANDSSDNSDHEEEKQSFDDQQLELLLDGAGGVNSDSEMSIGS